MDEFRPFQQNLKLKLGRAPKYQITLSPMYLGIMMSRTTKSFLLLILAAIFIPACARPEQRVDDRPLLIFTNDFHDRRFLAVCWHNRSLNRNDLVELAKTYYIVDPNGKGQIVRILEKNNECRPSSSEQLELGQVQSQCYISHDNPPCRSGIVLVPIR